MEGTIGEIRLFAGNFAPRSWAYCDGTALSISEYSALYAVIGDTYGGDGITNFELPNLYSRIAIGTGTGPGLPGVSLGEVGGTETVTMTINQMPAHTHIGLANITTPASSGAGSGGPTDAVLASTNGAYSSEQPDSHLAPITTPLTLSATGMAVPFSIMQPVTALNYIICLEGIFPSRN